VFRARKSNDFHDQKKETPLSLGDRKVQERARQHDDTSVEGGKKQQEAVLFFVRKPLNVTRQVETKEERKLAINKYKGRKC
jgi:hypothetical protein